MYSGNKRLNYTNIYQSGASRTRHTSGTGKHAGRGLSSPKHKPSRALSPSMLASLRRDEEEELKKHKKGPEEVIQAILLWLKESLSPMLKRAINFDANLQTSKYSDPRVTISLNPAYSGGRRAHGEIEFTSDRVTIRWGESRWSLSGQNIGIEYGDPELFDKMQSLLSRFYNGT